MTETDARQHVEAALPDLREMLNLHGWTIAITYPRLDGPKGEADVSPAYKEAWVRIDPNQADGPRDLLETLRHELLHVATWPMQAFIELRGADGGLDETEAFFLERLVAEVEGVLDNVAPIDPAVVKP